MKQIKEYFFKVRWIVMAVTMITFITHGALLFSQSFGVDTELLMNGSHNFNLIGRQGLVWLAKLLELEWFNLYQAQVLAFSFMILAPLSFGFLFYWFGGVKRIMPAHHYWY